MRNSDGKRVFRRTLPARGRVYRLPVHMRPDAPEPEKKPCRPKPDTEEVRLRRTHRWQRLRKVALATHPACMLCGTQKAVLVHHIVPAGEDIEQFFVLGNLAPLCLSCHRRVHEAYERGVQPEAVFPPERRLEECPE